MALLKPFRAAQAALDLALWDLAAKREGLGVAELALGEKPRPVKSFATIGLSDPEELKAKVAELREFPLIKVKMDHGVDLGALRFIREENRRSDRSGRKPRMERDRPPAPVGTARGPGRDIHRTAAAGGGDARMEKILPQSRLPILADESCATLEDLERMPGRYSGFKH